MAVVKYQPCWATKNQETEKTGQPGSKIFFKPCRRRKKIINHEIVQQWTGFIINP
jgi:hypothetical protein